MTQVGIYILTALTFLISSTTQNIEKSFLQNNPDLVYSLLSSQKPIYISLPPPISFSDQLSNQQAYFLFKNIFSTYTTFEFYSQRKISFPGEQKYILKTRWSFKNKKNKNQYVFTVYFYLLQNPTPDKSKLSWKISEIRAIKI